MFFGHEVKSNNQAKTSPLTLETDVKLSQAVLDPSSKGGNKKEPVCIMAEIGGKSFILAVLDPSQSWQCALDLVLAAGTAVKFFLRGQGTVHLTGYEIRDDLGDDLEMSLSSESDSDVSLDESAKTVVAQKARTPTQAKNIPVKTKAKSPATNGVKSEGKANGKPVAGGTKPGTSSESSDDEDFDVDDIDDEDDDLDDSDEELSFGEISDDSDDEMESMDDDEENDDDDDDEDDN